MAVREVLWAAVRKGEREFIDIKTLSHYPDLAEDKAREIDDDMPIWSKANPVVRYARVYLRELEED